MFASCLLRTCLPRVFIRSVRRTVIQERTQCVQTVFCMVYYQCDSVTSSPLMFPILFMYYPLSWASNISDSVLNDHFFHRYRLDWISQMLQRNLQSGSYTKIRSVSRATDRWRKRARGRVLSLLLIMVFSCHKRSRTVGKGRRQTHFCKTRVSR